VPFEELSEQGSRFIRQHPAQDLRPVVEPPIPYDIPERSDCASLGIECPKNEALKSGRHDGARTHCAGFKGHDQGAALQPPLTPSSGRLTDRKDLGMPSGVTVALTCVVAAADHHIVSIDNYGSNRDVTIDIGRLRK